MAEKKSAKTEPKPEVVIPEQAQGCPVVAVPEHVKQKIVDHLNGKRAYGREELKELLSFL